MGGVSHSAVRIGSGMNWKLQWGPPGMGGVSAQVGAASTSQSKLQWGPPGMGGVSKAAIDGIVSGPGTSMGTSRNGRCETR